MSNFSNKYNIKINNTDNIIDILSTTKIIKKVNKYNSSQLYFIKDTINIKDIKKFDEINNYAVIIEERGKKEIILYDKEIYRASLIDELIAVKLMVFYGYKVLFLVQKSIYEYNINNIRFNVQHVNNKDYYLTFDINTKDEYIEKIIDLFKNKLNIDLDDKLYFDIIQDEFESSK